MSSSSCIATEAMAALRSMSQLLEREYKPLPSVDAIQQQHKQDQEAILSWVKKYVAEHQEQTWWMVEEAKLNPVLNGLPLTSEDREDMMDLVNALLQYSIHQCRE